ncbi:hypothetical protein ILYODFUR_017110 [Ilyodon furcidens]|uniref:Uncharacterized protein n=1 Tax=Ilyodon furcidens TaxID=33524 RepID=A0ABV0U657_9TELE
MAQRKEVFKAKVLQKLYPAITTLQREQNLSAIAEDQATTVNGKRKSCGEDGTFGEAVKVQNAASLCRRMYTVLPPPPGYNVHSEKYVTPPQLESIDTAEDLADSYTQRNMDYTFMGKTSDLTVVQQTVIDTLHEEVKPQRLMLSLPTCTDNVNIKIWGAHGRLHSQSKDLKP